MTKLNTFLVWFSVMCHPHFMFWFWRGGSFCLPVSELQEEGINAINLPLSPSHYELDPEDTMLGNLSRALLLLFTILNLISSVWFWQPSWVSELACMLVLCDFLFLEENEVRTMVDPNSKNDRKLQELMKVTKWTAPLCLRHVGLLALVCLQDGWVIKSPLMLGC